LNRTAAGGGREGRSLWRNPTPKSSYEVVIVGAGGHGLATAYYLARNHGVTDVAVLDRGWLGGGNMARNTTIIRSNYLEKESIGIYEYSLKLWESLSEELDHDLSFRQCGVLTLAHSTGDVRDAVRRLSANRANGVDAEWLTPAEIHAFCPLINVSDDVRHPVLGATLQRRGGTANHNQVAWAFANRADSFGVDLLQGCEVNGIEVRDGRATAVHTSRGRIAANRIALCGAGHSSLLASMAGLEVPIQTRPLQALVSELLDPILDCVVLSNTVHVYVSQTEKGELLMGAGMDGYNSYAERGSVQIIEGQVAAALELFPIFSHVQVVRTWAGVVDVSPDASPIVGLTPVKNLFLNCGWGTGGFKATPGVGWANAYTIAEGEPHPLVAPFSIDRFTSGALIDEHGAASVAH